MENIRFTMVFKDGTSQPIDVSGVNNLIGAVLEIVQSIVDGDFKFDPDDIVQFIDIAG